MADSGGSRRGVDRRPPPLPGTASGTASGTAGTAPGPTGPASAEPPTSPSNTRKQPPHRDLRTGITAQTTVSPPSSSVPCPTDVTPLPPPTVSPEPARSAAPPRHSASSTTNRPCPDPGLQPLHEAGGGCTGRPLGSAVRAPGLFCRCMGSGRRRGTEPTLERQVPPAPSRRQPTGPSSSAQAPRRRGSGRATPTSVY